MVDKILDVPLRDLHELEVDVCRQPELQKAELVENVAYKLHLLGGVSVQDVGEKFSYFTAFAPGRVGEELVYVKSEEVFCRRIKKTVGG